MKKIKKIIEGSIFFLSTLVVTTQVKAIEVLYGIPNTNIQELYGPQPMAQKASLFQKFLPILLIIFIPIILIIGVVVFIKKRKSRNKDKKW